MGTMLSADPCAHAQGYDASEHHSRTALFAPLTHRFEQRDDRRHSDVERIGLTGHWDAHGLIAMFQPKLAQAVLLAAHDDRERSAKIDVAIYFFRCRRGRHRAD